MVAGATAVASKVTGRPARLVLDRNEDMATSGGRHPFLANYKVSIVCNESHQISSKEAMENLKVYAKTFSFAKASQTSCPNYNFLFSF